MLLLAKRKDSRIESRSLIWIEHSQICIALLLLEGLSLLKTGQISSMQSISCPVVWPRRMSVIGHAPRVVRYVGQKIQTVPVEKPLGPRNVAIENAKIVLCVK